MTFAICLQVPNHLHFKKPLNIYAEFIPQMLFMQSIFGYLVVCIIYKWSIDWSTSATSPPGLLNMLIYMFLSPGTVDPDTQLYAGQSFVQVVLVLIAMVCIPWMLCLKPYVLYREHQKIKEQGYQGLGSNEQTQVVADNDVEDAEDGHVAQEMDEEHEFEMGDVIVHQVIHTIEFCLGCISNT
jgi:V-type H+-transporting ATPase subunit a